MRIVSLASGSKGNVTIVEEGDAALLIDCGLSGREFAKRCFAAKVDSTMTRSLPSASAAIGSKLTRQVPSAATTVFFDCLANETLISFPAVALPQIGTARSRCKTMLSLMSVAGSIAAEAESANAAKATQRDLHMRSNARWAMSVR